MLAIMSYSTGIFLGVCTGLSLGYLVVNFFQPKYLEGVDVMRACH